MRIKQPHVVVVNWKDGSHPAAGGAEVFCESVARELVELGMRVTLLVGSAPGLAPRDTRDGYRIRRLGSTYTVYALVLLWLFKHRRHIDAVIDSQNGIPFFTPLALRRITPVALLIHHVHQEQFRMYFSPLMARVGRALEGPVSRLVYGERAVCAVSPSSRMEIRRQLRLQGPIYVIPNGADPQDQPRARRTPTPSIACVGRLVPHKRFQLLVAAMDRLRQRVPDVRLDLIGAGPELEALRAQVVRLGLQDVVTVHGFVTAEERDRLLAQAWLTVSTSVGEGWGLSMIEAARLGVPAVAIDVPGLRDSVRDGVTGWLTTEQDLTGALQEALGALRNPTTAAAYSQRCMQWANSLRWSASAERFHAVLSAESARLTGRERQPRLRHDLATVVTLAPAAAARFDFRVLNHTDQSTFCRQCLDRAAVPARLLLHGADEQDTAEVLAAAGIDPHTDEVQVALLRPRELLSWQGEGVSHSHLSFATHTCPTPLPSATPIRFAAAGGSA